MKTPRSHSRCFVLLAVVAAVPVEAQTVPATPATDPKAIVLSVFEVNSDKETGYSALSTMTGTRTNERLLDLPNSISVMTKEFLEDIAINNFMDAVDFATNAENTFNDQGTRGAVAGSRSGNSFNIRGTVSTRQLRDGFPWYIAQDMYNTERIEWARGPNGLAFGDIDVGGILNVGTKRALSKRQYSTQIRYDNWGSQRYSIDLNQPLAKTGVSVRLNAIHGENESWRQRSGAVLRGYAAAIRWDPFAHHRTIIDFTYEHGKQREGFGHAVLDDQTAGYVRGTGTNALDADPNRPGSQSNGAGRNLLASATSTNHPHVLIDGRVYNPQSTSTAAFRSSWLPQGATVADGIDPVNPRQLPLLGISESIVPRGEDWGGPDNSLTTTFFAYTLEMRHTVTDRLHLLFAHNAQKDDTNRGNFFNGNPGNYGTRDVMIDVDPFLPDPTDVTRTRLIPNKRYEQYYVNHYPATIIDGHDVVNFRAAAVFDASLPWSIQQRFVLGASYRNESYYKDTFSRSLSREEILRRGYTGVEARYSSNFFYYRHYLTDGNSDAALADPVIPGITKDFRFTQEGGSSRFKQNLGSANLSMLGAYFKGRLRSSIGISRDYFKQRAYKPLRADPVTNEQKFVDLNDNLIENDGMNRIDPPLVPFSAQWVTNQTYGAVWHVTPWLSFTGGYFESSQFSDNFARDLNGNPRMPKTGEGNDYSIRFNLLDQRVGLNVTYFQTSSENIASTVNAQVINELNLLLANPFFNNGDYRDQRAHGYEVELVTNMARNWTVRGSLGTNYLIFSRFFPLLEEKLTLARAAASSRGLNPNDATLITREYLVDQAASATGRGRKSINLTSRYSLTEGKLRGLSVGGSIRHYYSKDRAAVNVGGRDVLPFTKTKALTVYSPFVSYRKKMRQYSWTAQLNVNNILDRVSDQGNSYRYTRWTDPRQIITTVTVTY